MTWTYANAHRCGLVGLRGTVIFTLRVGFFFLFRGGEFSHPEGDVENHQLRILRHQKWSVLGSAELEFDTENCVWVLSKIFKKCKL